MFRRASASVMLCHAQSYSFKNDLHLIQATCIAKQCTTKACHYSSISSSIVSAARRLLLALGFTGSWWNSACLFALTPCAVISLSGWTCTAASIIGEVVTTHKMHNKDSRHTCHTVAQAGKSRLMLGCPMQHRLHSARQTPCPN